jgi:hypothetical protein
MAGGTGVLGVENRGPWPSRATPSGGESEARADRAAHGHRSAEPIGLMDEEKKASVTGRVPEG